MGRRGRQAVNSVRRYAGARKRKLPECTKQLGYRTRVEAAQVLLAMATSGDRREAQAYWCAKHQCYHLTSRQRF